MNPECLNLVMSVSRECKKRVTSGEAGSDMWKYGDVEVQKSLLALSRNVRSIMQAANVPLEEVEALLVDTHAENPDFDKQLKCGHSIHDFARKIVAVRLSASVKTEIGEKFDRLHPGVIEALSLMPETKAVAIVQAPFFEKLLIGNKVQLKDHGKEDWDVAGSGSIDHVPVNLVELGNSNIDFGNIDANVLTEALVCGNHAYWEKLKDAFSPDQASALIGKATRWFFFDRRRYAFEYLAHIPADRLQTMSDDDFYVILGIDKTVDIQQQIREWLALQ